MCLLRCLGERLSEACRAHVATQASRVCSAVIDGVAVDVAVVGVAVDVSCIFLIGNSPHCNWQGRQAGRARLNFQRRLQLPLFLLLSPLVARSGQFSTVCVCIEYLCVSVSFPETANL